MKGGEGQRERTPPPQRRDAQGKTYKKDIREETAKAKPKARTA